MFRENQWVARCGAVSRSYLDHRTWGGGDAGSIGEEGGPRGWQGGRKSESWEWSEGEPGKGAGGAWGRGLESRRGGSTLETGGLPPPGVPLWCPPAPGKRNKNIFGIYVTVGQHSTHWSLQISEMCTFYFGTLSSREVTNMHILSRDFQHCWVQISCIGKRKMFSLLN